VRKRVANGVRERVCVGVGQRDALAVGVALRVELPERNTNGEPGGERDTNGEPDSVRVCLGVVVAVADGVRDHDALALDQRDGVPVVVGVIVSAADSARVRHALPVDQRDRVPLLLGVPLSHFDPHSESIIQPHCLPSHRDCSGYSVRVWVPLRDLYPQAQ
jgi:hypothetical protein